VSNTKINDEVVVGLARCIYDKIGIVPTFTLATANYHKVVGCGARYKVNLALKQAYASDVFTSVFVRPHDNLYTDDVYIAIPLNAITKDVVDTKTKDAIDQIAKAVDKLKESLSET